MDWNSAEDVRVSLLVAKLTETDIKVLRWKCDNESPVFLALHFAMGATKLSQTQKVAMQLLDPTLQGDARSMWSNLKKRGLCKYLTELIPDADKFRLADLGELPKATPQYPLPDANDPVFRPKLREDITAEAPAKRRSPIFTCLAAGVVILIFASTVSVVRLSGLLPVLFPPPTRTPTPTLRPPPTDAPTATSVIPAAESTLVASLFPAAGKPSELPDSVALVMGDDWSLVSGEPIVTDDTLTALGPTWFRLGDPDWENYTLEFDVKFYMFTELYCEPDRSLKVGLRVENEQNMALVQLSDCTFNEGSAWLIDGGRARHIPATNQPLYTPQQFMHVKIDVEDSNIVLRLATLNANEACCQGAFGFAYDERQTGYVLLFINEGIFINNIRVTLPH